MNPLSHLKLAMPIGLAVHLLFVTPSRAADESPAFAEENTIVQARKLFGVHRYGEAEKLLRGLKSPVARAYRAGLIWKDSADLRAHGITKFNQGEAEQTIKEVLPLLKRRASTDPSAAKVLAAIYLWGVGIEPNTKESFDLLINLAEKSDPGAMAGVGIRLLQGVGVSKDESKGMSWLKRAAELGDEHALFVLGTFYKEGNGVKKDEATGAMFFEKSARLGNVDAMMECALTALKRSEKALKAGELKAAIRYTSLYEKWLESAADLGNVQAMMSLAFHHQLGFPPNEKLCFSWYSRAADSGIAYSLFQLAACYATGLRCESDQQRAEELLVQAVVAAKREENTDLGDKLEKLLAEKNREVRITAIREALGWDSKVREIPPDELPNLGFSEPSMRSRGRPGNAEGNLGVPNEPPAQIQVIDTVWQRSASGNFVEINGRIRNVSGHDLEAVTVTVTFENASGGLVKTSESFLSPNPLAAGRVGDFKVIERSDPTFDHYKVRFRKFAGAEIP